ncbi:unnamed protein product, partial [Amoebophrya sp. A120]|eukprot:GSA120T00001738001.1
MLAVMNETLFPPTKKAKASVVGAGTTPTPAATATKTNAGGTSSSTSSAPLKNYIGILDIAGFESFASNSLEQLFINLSNETLQQYFNDYVFKSELQDYAAEGVKVDLRLEFFDNLDILELIQGKQGILDCLDEELNVNKATFETYAKKVNKNFEKHARFVKNRFSRPQFAIKHFAGEVEYSCVGWLEKNLDEPPRETVDLMQKAESLVLSQMGARCATKYGLAPNKSSDSSSTTSQQVAPAVVGYKSRMALQSKKLT